MEFKLKAEKLKLLTDEDLIELGWEQKVSEHRNNVPTKFYYQKGNYFLMLREFDGVKILRIHPIDASKVEGMPDPENCRVIVKLPTKEALKMLESLLL